MPYEHDAKIAVIEAEDTFTAWMNIQGIFQIHISNLVDSTITFQGSPNGGEDEHDLVEFTSAADNGLYVDTVAVTNWVYRIGCKTGDFGSEDRIYVRLEA